MYALILVILLTGDEMAFAPNGEVVQFKDEAACEAVAAKQKSELDKLELGPYTLECRKA